MIVRSPLCLFASIDRSESSAAAIIVISGALLGVISPEFSCKSPAWKRLNRIVIGIEGRVNPVSRPYLALLSQLQASFI